MQWLRDLLIGAGGSLLAALVIVLTATWRSVTVRRALTAVASAFLGVEVKYVFPHGKAAEPTVHAALAAATRVRIFAGRGNDFQGSYYAPLFDARQTVRHVQILLPNIHSRARSTDWIENREAELVAIDRSFGTGLLRKQIATSIAFLEKHRAAGTFELRLYDAPHFGRIIITDDTLFLTPYSATKHGRDSHVIQHGRGDMYDAYTRLFDKVWQDSMDLEPAREADSTTLPNALHPTAWPEP